MSGKHLSANTGSNNSWDPGTPVVKIFNGVFFEGEVTEVYEGVDKNNKPIKWWHVQYHDGDEEDLDENEMKSVRKLYISVSRSKVGCTNI